MSLCCLQNKKQTTHSQKALLNVTPNSPSSLGWNVTYAPYSQATLTSPPFLEYTVMFSQLPG